MFILIISESAQLLNIAKSSLIKNKNTSIFESMLYPPKRRLGMPILDPFNELLSFDFSDKLVFPPDTLVLHLDGNNYFPVDDQSFCPEKLSPIYSDAFKGIMENGKSNSSTYLRSIKKNRLEIREKISQRIKNNKKDLSNELNGFAKEWEKYANNNGYPYISLKAESECEQSLTKHITNTVLNLLQSHEISLKRKFHVNQLSNQHVNCSFTMPYSSMGFGDFYQRLEKLYDFVKTITGFKFQVEPYINPHSTELDFNELVNICGDQEDDISRIEKTIEISDFYTYILSSSFQEKETKFNIILGPGRAILNNTSPLFKTRKQFIRTLRLDLPTIDFKPYQSKDSIKVVYHMRRHDTALKPFVDIIPDNIRKKLGVERPLLDFVSCDAIVKSYLSSKNQSDKKLEIVVISDGVDDLEVKYNKITSDIENNINSSKVNQVFKSLKNELNFGRSNIEGSMVSNRVIGRDSDKTLKSVKAIQEADFVITSSGFSIFMARIVGADYVNGFQALPMLDKGLTDLSKIITKNKNERS